MKNTTFAYSFLSLLIPFFAYAIFFLTGLAPSHLSQPSVYGLLLVFNSMGFVLSIVILSKLNRKPTDTSNKMLIAVLMASIAIFANTIAIEVIIYNYLIVFK